MFALDDLKNEMIIPRTPYLGPEDVESMTPDQLRDIARRYLTSKSIKRRNSLGATPSPRSSKTARGNGGDDKKEVIIIDDD